MANFLFQDLVNQGKTAGVLPNTKKSLDWFKSKAATVTRITPNKLMKAEEMSPQMFSSLTVNDIGRMYHFFYDAKHKKTLPYWDRFPLIYVISFYPDGFLGMNLHYLPPILRAKLMNALYDISIESERRGSEKRIALSYGLLKKTAKYKAFTPCVKRYLIKHVKSRFLHIPSDQWDLAIMLPTERFQKAGKGAVWSDSREIING